MFKIPDQDGRAAELPVGGVQEPVVIGPGEALASDLAGPRSMCARQISRARGGHRTTGMPAAFIAE